VRSICGTRYDEKNINDIYVIYFLVFNTPFIHLSKAICTWLKDQGKEIKSLPSLISREACERNLLLAQMSKRRFSVFQWKNTNRPCINGIFRFQNRPWINGWREYVIIYFSFDKIAMALLFSHNYYIILLSGSIVYCKRALSENFKWEFQRVQTKLPVLVKVTPWIQKNNI
jgi:hypothetical protein